MEILPRHPMPEQQSAESEYDGDTEQQAQALLVRSTTTEAFSGPLPPPPVLQGYEDVQPGFAERIMQMAESENRHRQQMERDSLSAESVALREDLQRAKHGLYIAALVAVLFLAASTTIAVFVDTLAGTVLSGVDIVILAAVFVHGARQRTSAVEAETRYLSQSNENV